MPRPFPPHMMRVSVSVQRLEVQRYSHFKTLLVALLEGALPVPDCGYVLCLGLTVCASVWPHRYKRSVRVAVLPCSSAPLAWLPHAPQSEQCDVCPALRCWCLPTVSLNRAATTAVRFVYQNAIA